MLFPPSFSSLKLFDKHALDFALYFGRYFCKMLGVLVFRCLDMAIVNVSPISSFFILFLSFFVKPWGQGALLYYNQFQLGFIVPRMVPIL